MSIRGDNLCGTGFQRCSIPPSCRDLPNDAFNCLLDIPVGIVFAHLAQVAVVADMVADAVLVYVAVNLCLAGEGFGDGERFEDGATVLFAAAEVVDFSNSWRIDEGGHEASDIFTMYVVTDLLAFVAKDFVLAAFKIAFHKVAEEAV